jgi:hypothetical protein
MAIRKNPDGTVSVGIIREEKPAEKKPEKKKTTKK